MVNWECIARFEFQMRQIKFREVNYENGADAKCITKHHNEKNKRVILGRRIDDN